MDLDTPLPKHPLITYRCNCGKQHSTNVRCPQCGASGIPMMMGVLAHVALDLADFEDSKGRTLRDRLQDHTPKST